MQSGLFDLPKRTHQPTNTDNKTDVEYVIIDATEVCCERPPKKTKSYHSGKQKQHTPKIQVIYNPNISKIVAIHAGKGSTHDVKRARTHLGLILLSLCYCR